MVEEASSAPRPATPGMKMTMVVGVDDSEPSFYALRWLLQQFFPPVQPQQQHNRLVVVTATPSTAVGIAGPGALMDVRGERQHDRVGELRWLLQHFFPPGLPQQQLYRLVVITGTPSAAIGIAGALMDVRAFVESDLKRNVERFIDKAKELCALLQVIDAKFEALEENARSVLCDAVERHRAEMLVVGSHGYGAIKRAVLGSVRGYCAHHAHCTVMIVKKPKPKH
ncbi:unnamed protein product [Urochloa decumbens]|uniref:UspA domain-containing protein n=1 Tax=Urochloa decumbens TaxID=240449 RepID=A0ABC8YWH7_9POAL